MNRGKSNGFGFFLDFVFSPPKSKIEVLYFTIVRKPLVRLRFQIIFYAEMFFDIILHCLAEDWFAKDFILTKLRFILIRAMFMKWD